MIDWIQWRQRICLWVGLWVRLIGWDRPALATVFRLITLLTAPTKRIGRIALLILIIMIRIWRPLIDWRITHQLSTLGSA